MDLVGLACRALKKFIAEVRACLQMTELKPLVMGFVRAIEALENGRATSEHMACVYCLVPSARKRAARRLR